MLRRAQWAIGLGAVALCAALAAPEAKAQVIAGRNYSSAGVRPLTCTLNTTTTTCGPFYPVAGRTFHVTHAPSAFTASCQLEREPDGVNWAQETVTASGSTTQMGNWSFSSSSTVISEDFEDDQWGVPYRVHCTSVSGGSDAVTLSE